MAPAEEKHDDSDADETSLDYIGDVFDAEKSVDVEDKITVEQADELTEKETKAAESDEIKGWGF